MNDSSEFVILHEDNHIIVVLKEQNIPCCEDESGDRDLLTMVKDYIKTVYNKPGNAYVGLVHRLDRPTGGVMVFAKTSKAAARLSEQLREGDFSKKYLAVLNGCPREEAGTLENYLKKNVINNMVYIASKTVDGAKYAHLKYRILEKMKNLSLAEITLYTGRSHQIRVQMAGINCPLYNDMKYGDGTQKGNLALWAYELSFAHPVTKEKMVFRVEPPRDAPWKAFDLHKVIEIKG